MPQPNHRSRRGMSLVEGMMSMAVLVIGILGALQGILFASQQNAVANKLARATSMAAQIRLGLESQGLERLRRSGGLLTSATCIPVGSASPALKALTDGLDATTVANACIVDVDAYDLGSNGGGTGTGAPVLDKLVAGYDYGQDFKGDRGPFRRLVVYLPTPGTAAETGAFSFAVVVSTSGIGRRIFVRQFVALYDSSASATPSNPLATGNGSGVNL